MKTNLGDLQSAGLSTRIAASGTGGNGGRFGLVDDAALAIFFHRAAGVSRCWDEVSFGSWTGGGMVFTSSFIRFHNMDGLEVGGSSGTALSPETPARFGLVVNS